MDRGADYLFVGVGGMGMAPLACWMADSGYSVCGYDANLREDVARWLRAAAVRLEDFVFPEEIGDFRTLVYSSAVAAEHELLVAARAAGVRCLRRGELLAEIARNKKLIAVVGSHGKTTTSGMIAHGMVHNGIEAGYVLGGLFADGQHPPARYHAGEWLVAEVDESDGTIDAFAPEVTVLLNMDWDHADLYPSAGALGDTFERLLERTKGTVYLPADAAFSDTGRAERRVFDRAAGAHGLEVSAAARFSAVNADAAAAALAHLGGDLAADSLSSFPGMARRQSVMARGPGWRVLQDYAHHPTEIDALIENLRAAAPDEAVTVVFQPHRYSRTLQFKQAFAAVLGRADRVFLLPVYGAHETPVDGGGAEDLQAAFGPDAPELLPLSAQGLRTLSQRLCPANGAPEGQVAFVGAGDIESFAAAFSALLGAGHDLDQALEAYLRPRLSPDCRWARDEPLANKTTMRIGGPARWYAEPANVADVQVLLGAARLFAVPTFALGRGSNLLVPDEGFDGIVLRFSAPVWRQLRALGGGRLWAGAGGRLKEICGFAAKQGLGGFEFMEGIPGAIGGSLRMNAGAMGSWIFDLVERVHMIDAAGHYRDLPREAFHFGYRKVEEISEGIALGAILRSPQPDEEADIRGRIDSYSNSRKESQPRGASAGCIFKNPAGNHAGKLVDELGLKGLSVGGAEVSPVHANFIVNRGGATSADVVELVRQIRQRVKAERNIVLEPEVLLVGRSWDEVLSD